MSRSHQLADYLGILLFVAIPLLLGYSSGFQTSMIGGLFPIYWVFASSYLIHLIAFIPSFLYHTEKYFDFIGMVAYLSGILVALLLVYQRDSYLSFRTISLALMVSLWSLRLGIFLFQRIILEKEDRRFREVKHSFSGFLQAWIISAAWVCLTAANAFTAIINNNRESVHLFFSIGFILWTIGFSFEVIADHQKQCFKRDQKNKNNFISTGLWSISRHPNYFGEITLWFGIALISYPVLEGWQTATLISPLFVYILLTRITGINLLEKKSNLKWGNNVKYQEYKRKTPILFPLLYKRK